LKARSHSTRRVSGKKLEILARRLRDSFGVPVRQHSFPEPLELLIATVLSQNTNDINSHRAFTNLKGSIPDFTALDSASPLKIERLIKVGGIAKKKSRAIIKIVREIKKKFNRFDRKTLKRIGRDQLVESLKEITGIGYKTAACVSLFAIGDDDAFPVDTHVHRILNRLGIVDEKTPDKTYNAVKDSIPSGMGYQLHINLIKFGRTTCTSQKPSCFGCPLYDICGWVGKSMKTTSNKPPVRDRRSEFMLLENV